MKNFKKGFSKLLLVLLLASILAAGMYYAWPEKFSLFSSEMCNQSGDESRSHFGENNELVFTCHKRKVVNLEENKCVYEIFNAQTGKIISSQEGACVTDFGYFDQY